ncbi:MAG: hypothetical protein AAF485_06105 [Chloroflexota bacterium]
MTALSETQLTKSDNHPQRPVEKVYLLLLIGLYVVIAIAHASLAPLTTGPDELAHYEYANFIANQGRLPLDFSERETASYKSDQPPLYHLVASIPAAWVDSTGPPFLKRVNDHDRRQLIERTRHAWGLYNTEDEQWPYRAEILRWQIGRWVAILFGVATIWLTFIIAREIFAELHYKKAGPFALGSAAIVAFVPRFMLTGSMLNYETTLAFFSALFLWWLLRIARRISTSEISAPTWSTLLYSGGLLGIFAGLSITAKLSALILPVEIVFGLGLIVRYQGWGWIAWIRWVFAAAIGTLLAVSWWFGFIAYQFNTVAEEGWWVGILRPLIAADGSDATTNRILSLLTNQEAGFVAPIENLDSGPPWEWATIFFRTFWVVGIEDILPLGWFGLIIALSLSLLATWGVIKIWRSAEPSHSPQSDELNPKHNVARKHLLLSLLLLHCVAPFVLPLIRYAITFSLSDTAQGRHILFSAAPAIAILLILGFTTALQALSNNTRFNWLQWQDSYSFLPAVFLLGWSLTQLWVMTWAYNPLLPVQAKAASTVSAIAHPARQPINDAITLLGHTSEIDPAKQLIQVDLFWEATSISPVDYLTDVALVDTQGEQQARWLGYPAAGRYPTRAWDVGDVVRDTIWVPSSGIPQGQYTLTLNLLSTTSFQPALDTPIRLETLSLAADGVSSYTNVLALNSVSGPIKYTLWQNGQALTDPDEFRYQETVLITLEAPKADTVLTFQLVGPTQQSYSPIHRTEKALLFNVGPDWPTGHYQLQATVIQDEEIVEQVQSEAVFHVTDRWQRTFEEPPMQQRVEANFANQVKLIGYDLENNRAEPGGGIPVTLYWQGLAWMGDDYTIFTKLLRATDQSVHGGRDRLPREGYRTIYWAPSEIIADSFGSPVDDDAPDGIYYLNVGLYKEVDNQAVSLPLMHEGAVIDTTSINIGPIKIGQPATALTQQNIAPQTAVNQPFGEPQALTLLGYDLADSDNQALTEGQIAASEVLKLTLYWQSEAPLPIDYTAFIHIRDKSGAVVAQKDQPPLHGAYPTSLWDTGDIIADEIMVPLPDNLSTDAYELWIGLYDLQTGLRLAVPNNPANDLFLSEIGVSP